MQARCPSCGRCSVIPARSGLRSFRPVSTLRRFFYLPAILLAVAIAGSALLLATDDSNAISQENLDGSTRNAVVGIIVAFGVLLVGAIAFAALADRHARHPTEVRRAWECLSCGHRWIEARKYDHHESAAIGE